MPVCFDKLGPTPGPHTKAWLFLLTKLFVCLPCDPWFWAGSCGWFTSLAVSAGPGLSLPSSCATGFRPRPRRVQRVLGLSTTLGLCSSFLCSSVPRSLLLVLAWSIEVKYRKHYLGFDAKRERKRGVSKVPHTQLQIKMDSC